MAEHWISAKTALAIANTTGDVYSTCLAICKRANAGLIQAKAQLLIFHEERKENCIIAPKFWWAEGHEALTQDWESGDFSTFIDSKHEFRVFGVCFAASDILKMLPIERRSSALRGLSVLTDPAWCTALEARKYIYSVSGINPAVAGDALVEYCRLGFVPARALEMQTSFKGVPENWDVEEREAEVPIWFWQSFAKANASSQDWQLGLFQGEGTAFDKPALARLSGVHFYRDALSAFDKGQPKGTPKTASKGGRPPASYWDDLWSAMATQLYEGDLQPKRQADIEKAMQDWASANGHEPAVSTIRDRARKLWLSLSREDEN